MTAIRFYCLLPRAPRAADIRGVPFRVPAVLSSSLSFLSLAPVASRASTPCLSNLTLSSSRRNGIGDFSNIVLLLETKAIAPVVI
jgi:hypothetical protein